MIGTPSPSWCRGEHEGALGGFMQKSDGPSDLLRLVETEQQLDGELAAARDEAARLVAAARASALERERLVAAEVDAESARVRTEIAGQLESRLAAIAAEGEQQVRGYRSVDDERVGMLAAGMVRRLVAPEDPP